MRALAILPVVPVPVQKPCGDMCFYGGIRCRFFSGCIAVQCFAGIAGIALGIDLRGKQKIPAVRTVKNAFGFRRDMSDVFRLASSRATRYTCDDSSRADIKAIWLLSGDQRGRMSLLGECVSWRGSPPATEGSIYRSLRCFSPCPRP